VVIDRNRATGGGVTAGMDFALQMAGQWGGEAAGRLIELVVEYAPQPPYGTGRPELADEATLAAARQIMAGEFSEGVVDQAAQRLGKSRRGAAVPA
jgi:cyclohexyl-isocyanide hydratase